MSDVSNPARYAKVITPSDNDDFTHGLTRAIYVGSAAGNVVGVMTSEDGVTEIPVTFTAVPIGILPVQLKRVNATGTTSTGLIGLW